jgi:hypothetical protein
LEGGSVEWTDLEHLTGNDGQWRAKSPAEKKTGGSGESKLFGSFSFERGMKTMTLFDKETVDSGEQFCGRRKLNWVIGWAVSQTQNPRK